MCEKVFHKKDEQGQTQSEQPSNSAQNDQTAPQPVEKAGAGTGVRAVGRRITRIMQAMAAGSQSSSTIRHLH